MILDVDEPALLLSPTHDEVIVDSVEDGDQTAARPLPDQVTPLLTVADL
jgi:hypothetical protein